MNFILLKGLLPLLQGSTNTPFFLFLDFLPWFYFFLHTIIIWLSSISSNSIDLLYFIDFNRAAIQTDPFFKVKDVALGITVRVDFLVIGQLFIYLIVSIFTFDKLCLQSWCVKPKIQTHRSVHIWILTTWKKAKAFHHRFSHLLQTLFRVWFYFIVLCVSVVTILKGIALLYPWFIQLTSDGGEFVFGDAIGARVKVKLVLYFGHQKRKVVRFELLVELAAEKERIQPFLSHLLLFTMPVNVNQILYSLWRVLNLVKELSQVVCFWRQLLCYQPLTFNSLSLHFLFKSSPAKLQRELPWITPSGFTIGITIIRYFLRRVSA